MSKNIPKIEESNKFNFFISIWIVPFIALIIAGWLAYQYFSQLGPEIRIIFPKNEGLKAGQSQIKYRNVPVGSIKKIELQEDGEGIVVVARMDKSVYPFLNTSSKFWIVKPEVGIGGVSGLDTLISGTYINMYSEKEEEFKDDFIGQSHAYRDDSRGEYFVLNTPRGDSTVKVGTPIYLKNIQVGQVEYVVLALDNATVDVIVFIENEYTPYLRVDSNFWVRSTFSAGFNNGTFNISVAPITDLIQGAMEFSSYGKESTCTVPDGFVFKLYANKSVIENTYINKGNHIMELFKLKTKQAISKLHIGAPIRYEGFEVGKVKELKINYDKTTHAMQSSVFMNINLAVFADENDSLGVSGKINFKKAVKEGLRAQIIPHDPLTGLLFVDLSFKHILDTQTLYRDTDKVYVLPTINYQSGNLMASMTKILDKINHLPLEELVSSLTTVVKNANHVVQGVDKPISILLGDLKKTVKNLNIMTNKKSFSQMPDELDKTLNELTRMLKTTKKVVGGYDSNSLLARQLSDTLKIVTQTSKEMKFFLKMLNRKPTSMILGDK